MTATSKAPTALKELPTRLLCSKAVMALLGISRPTLFRLTVNDPTFPTPIKLSASRNAFVESELLEWINSRRAGEKRLLMAEGQRDVAA